jgi:AhpC/TSA family/Thiol:disulfide interchange protein DsbD, N-terminal
LFAISHDPVEVLAKFARKYNITFSLLSDQGSKVIRTLDLLNEQVQEHAVFGVPANRKYYGVPYPGTFVLDETVMVTEKRFHQSYRNRDTVSALLEAALGIASREYGQGAISQTEAVQVRDYLDSPTYAFNQIVNAVIELNVGPGLHVYGEPISEGYVPLSVNVEPLEGLVVGKPQWPSPARWTVAGIGEEFWVYQGKVRGLLPLTFAMPPGHGNLVIQITIAYQT